MKIAFKMTKILKFEICVCINWRTVLGKDEKHIVLNCVIRVHLSPFPYAQYLGLLKLVKMEIFLLKMMLALVGLKPLLPRQT